MHRADSLVNLHSHTRHLLGMGSVNGTGASTNAGQNRAVRMQLGAPASRGSSVGPEGPTNTVRQAPRPPARRFFSVEDDNTEPDTPPEDENNEDLASIASDESFTLRDRQEAINSTHPFGIRIWKPALYKKKRSVERDANEDIHSRPDRYVPWYVRAGNVLWTLTWGMFLGVTCLIASLPLMIAAFFSISAREYLVMFQNLALYFVWPFGKYIQLISSDAYLEEDAGQGRPLSDWLDWHNNDVSQTSRLFFAPRARRQSQLFDNRDRRHRFFGRGKWTVGRALFFTGFWILVVPVATLVSVLCWLGVFSIPMARVIMTLLHHAKAHPLALAFKPSVRFTDAEAADPERYAILMCTYRAFGWKYYKYTWQGTNIILLNMLTLVILTIADFYIFHLFPEWFRFTMSLLSIIPLAHFIGHAVASISAQSSMSMGATINAFFSTLVEVYLYIVALTQGKGDLVEGSIIGSVLAGVLLMPGLSMCAGAIKKKTQRFNPRSTGATSNMLMFCAAALLAPTVFYSFYAPVEIHCDENNQCWNVTIPLEGDDPLYLSIIKPFSLVCAVSLFLGYATGLLFTLHTHAAVIWATQTADEEEDVDSEEGPNWGRFKSYVILLTATVLYAIIAEVLVDSVDFVLNNFAITPRMLGITVFALVPNTTEFLNAISFAMYGNVALGLEIGSAYVLQVCMLQAPVLVLASLQLVGRYAGTLRNHAFIFVFPTWDAWAVFIAYLLYVHVHSEGKSNYFKGVILLLTYLVLLLGYHFFSVRDDLLPTVVSATPAH